MTAKRTPKKPAARRPAAKKRTAAKVASKPWAPSPEYLARAEKVARASKAEESLRSALADLGWKFSQGETQGRAEDYHHERRMNFHHRDHGTLFVSLAPNLF